MNKRQVEIEESVQEAESMDIDDSPFKNLECRPQNDSEDLSSLDLKEKEQFDLQETLTENDFSRKAGQPKDKVMLEAQRQVLMQQEEESQITGKKRRHNIKELSVKIPSHNKILQA